MSKPTPESVEALIESTAYHRWPGTTMISCAITAKNGHMATGESRPIDAADFNEARGRLEARKKAFAKLFDAVVYEYRSSRASEAES